MHNAYPYNPELKPGTWKRGKTLEGDTALFCCPDGHGMSLTRHTIASDGTVSPSLVCPHDDCDFHEFIKLEGWEE